MSVSERRPLLTSALLFALVALVSAGATAGETGQSNGPSVNAISSNAQLVSTQRALREFVAVHGATLSPVTFELRQSIGEAQTSSAYAVAGNSSAAAASSCTATAKVSVPGGTGITLSATAPTCAEALDMILDAVTAYLQRLPKMK